MDNDVTGYANIIRDNVFDMTGCGTGAHAVDINATGTYFVIDNMSAVDSSTTAFTSAGTGMWNNAQTAAGTMTLSVDDD